MVKKHGEKPEGKRAQEIIDRLNNRGTGPSRNVDIKKSPFKKQSGADHYFCIVLPKGTEDASKIENGVSDFNGQYFSQKSSLKVNKSLLWNKDHLIRVSKFSNKKEGMDYYRTFIQRSPVLKALNMEKSKIFLIAQENFGIMFRQQKSEAYMAFFRKVYLDQ